MLGSFWGKRPFRKVSGSARLMVMNGSDTPYLTAPTNRNSMLVRSHDTTQIQSGLIHCSTTQPSNTREGAHAAYYRSSCTHQSSNGHLNDSEQGSNSIR
ncbi:hypothetical protein AOLI_G00269540 [Acnodon oligacanthus]